MGEKGTIRKRQSGAGFGTSLNIGGVERGKGNVGNKGRKSQEEKSRKIVVQGIKRKAHKSGFPIRSTGTKVMTLNTFRDDP